MFIYKMKYLKRMGRTDPNGIMLPSWKCGCLLLLHRSVVQTHLYHLVIAAFTVAMKDLDYSYTIK